MKPSLPQGTRDFQPEVLRKRHFIIDTIKNQFELYGFAPLETPAFENIETLMGKYGDEGDKLIFKILNNGLDHPSKRDAALRAFDNVVSGKNDKEITSRALRYDLTIPFARFVAMNHHKLPIPFRRYQVQPVWRADRPQKGRYREFYQCDADIAGTNSLLADAELALLYRDVFKSLTIPATIRINNRKILSALSAMVAKDNPTVRIIPLIDKLDKIGLEAVKDEMARGGLTPATIETISKYLLIEGSNGEKIAALKNFFAGDEAGIRGIREIEEVLELASDNDAFILDPTLARGLEYYTGTIYEVLAKDVKIGSIGGGGRYDDLTGLFGVKGIPGVGISFGIDRIYDVMDELKLFPGSLAVSTQVLFFNMGERESRHAFGIMNKCRTEGISAEIYYEPAKLDKQFKYADKKLIPFAVIIGSREMESGECRVKELASGEESTLTQDMLYEFLKKKSIFKTFS